ncbi:MAG TPA: TlpA disulfide reductase family protein [Candidatus Angelobacter sp.]
MNRNVIFILCVVVAITALLLVGKRATKPPESANAANGNVQGTPAAAQNAGGPASGSAAPIFELKSIPDGKSTALASFHGKAVLLNFWATWCGPCKIEMPWLVDLQKKYGPQGLQIVGVAMDDTSDKEIADFAHKMGVNYIVLKGTEKVGDLYGGVEGLPTTYYLDRSGKVVDKTLGLAGESVIEDAIKKALAQGN